MVGTFTASLSPGRIKLAAELLPSLPLLDELPLLSRTTKGLTGGRRGEVGVVSMTATEASAFSSGGVLSSFISTSIEVGILVESLDFALEPVLGGNAKSLYLTI
jgi:hypothetical protein